jgi:2,4-dienoyl-CoA reductase (NADPH2)
MELRNRIVMSPMETMYGTADGLPSERTVAYFAARAAGGVGLITVGATGIDHQHPETPGGLHLGTDEGVVAHRRLVEAVHEHGAKIQPQIVHAGPDGLGPEMHGVTSLGPSVIPSYLTGRPSEAITPLQIAALMDQYKAAVRRAREAGYDGIELHAAHGYMMLGSFLAPQRNRRTDDYRGDRVHGRLRIVLEALAAIRSEVGEDFPITLRISGFERVAGGRPMYETAQVAPQLVAAGVNAFHVSGGVIDRLVSKMVNGSDDGDGLNVGAAAAVREAVDVPVIAVGRLHDPDLAESVLEAGKADFVAMGRPLLPNKLRTGGSVRQCISCENCIDALEIRFSVDCAVNPQTGREQDLTLRPTRSAQHVVVIGAGPGGMEAARSAAAIGHRVTLLEANRQLGGALLWASIVHPENQPFLDYLRSEIAAGPVEVRLGVRAGVEEVAALAPDAVIVATGGRVAVPAVEGDNLPHVLNGPALRELLAGRSTSDQPWSHRLGARLVAGRGQRLVTPAAVRLATKAWMPVGQRVVIIGADLVALEFAEFLAARGRRVTLLESGKDIAPEIGPKRKAEHMLRLDGLGVTVHVRAEVTRIVASGVEFVPAGGAARTLVADSVILAGTPESELTLYDALRERLPAVPVHAIGDSTGLGLIQKATADAARVVAGLNDA